MTHEAYRSHSALSGRRHLGLLATGSAPAGAQSGARIHLIHGIPDTPVDVAVGGTNVISDFTFGDTQDLFVLRRPDAHRGPGQSRRHRHRGHRRR